MVCLVVVCGFRRQRYYFFCIYANISDFLFCLLRPITLFIASKSDLDTALLSSLFPSVAFLPPLDSLYCADCQSAFPLPPFPPPLGGRGAFSFPLSSIASKSDLDTASPFSFVHFRAMLSPALLLPPLEGVKSSARSDCRWPSVEQLGVGVSMLSSISDSLVIL